MQLFPYGEVRAPVENPDGKEVSVVQVLDSISADNLLVAFNDAAKTPNFGGVLVDFDHFSMDTDKESRAAMWIEQLEKRADGMWFKARVTDSGRAALRGGDYRFISPVFDVPSKQYQPGQRVRPISLESAGLTNDPRIKGGVPISNRSASSVVTVATSASPDEAAMNEARDLVAEMDAMTRYNDNSQQPGDPALIDRRANRILKRAQEIRNSGAGGWERAWKSASSEHDSAVNHAQKMLAGGGGILPEHAGRSPLEHAKKLRKGVTNRSRRGEREAAAREVIQSGMAAVNDIAKSIFIKGTKFSWSEALRRAINDYNTSRINPVSIGEVDARTIANRATQICREENISYVRAFRKAGEELGVAPQ